jgi:hypothetical protein
MRLYLYRTGKVNKMIPLLVLDVIILLPLPVLERYNLIPLVSP